MGQTTSDQDIELMRQDLRNKKWQIIAENLPLSDAEAEKFWPIYQHYTDDFRNLGNQRNRNNLFAIGFRRAAPPIGVYSRFTISRSWIVAVCSCPKSTISLVPSVV
jgi:hypothetical protein